jgi:hypothetical protein
LNKNTSSQELLELQSLPGIRVITKDPNGQKIQAGGDKVRVRTNNDNNNSKKNLLKEFIALMNCSTLFYCIVPDLQST